MSDEPFQLIFDRCSNWGRWGADDERGTLNLITPDHTTRAAGLVRKGSTVSCSWPLNTVRDAENPRPAMHLMMWAGDSVDPLSAGSVADYLAVASHGTAHSHLDAPCHFSWQGKIYNNRSVSTVTSTGATKNAITISQEGIVTRGVLLDLPPSRNLEWLEPGTPIMPSDLEAAESAGDLRVGQGDVLLVRTGRHRRRQVHGPWNLFDGVAGLHHTCAPWLRERGVALLGCDGISDVLPSGVDRVRLPIHVLTLVAMGMQLLDNLNLEDLSHTCASQRRWEFLLAIAPLRLEGGTASPVNPIAVL